MFCWGGLLILIGLGRSWVGRVLVRFRVVVAETNKCARATGILNFVSNYDRGERSQSRESINCGYELHFLVGFGPQEKRD